MRLCMFHPIDHPLERGWVGRVDGDRVIQLAAQTLQSFFAGGGSAREHAEYPFADVVLLAPVLHPPSIRLFDAGTSFGFTNPAAIVGPGAVVRAPHGRLVALPRVAAVIGADGAIGGVTGLVELRALDLEPPKDRDFGLGLGPVVVTADELDVVDGFDWKAAVAYAGAGTVLYPGDILAGPHLDPVDVDRDVALEIPGVGTLAISIAEVD